MLDIKKTLAKILRELRSTNWANVPNKIGMNTLVYRIKHGVVYIIGYDNGVYSWTAGSWITLGCLPEGARPSRQIFGSGATRTGKTYEIQINPQGQIALQKNSADGWASFSISFPLGGVVHRLLKALQSLTLGRGWVAC